MTEQEVSCCDCASSVLLQSVMLHNVNLAGMILAFPQTWTFTLQHTLLLLQILCWTLSHVTNKLSLQLFLFLARTERSGRILSRKKSLFFYQHWWSHPRSWSCVYLSEYFPLLGEFEWILVYAKVYFNHKSVSINPQHALWRTVHVRFLKFLFI